MSRTSQSDIDHVCDAVIKVAEAITPNVCGRNDSENVYVSSLTEAAVGMTAALIRIADALQSISENMERNSKL